MVIYIKAKQNSENLLDLLRHEGHYIPAYCGGKGICGKCKVRFLVNAPNPTEHEKSFFTVEELDAGWRLACETEFSGEGQIELPMYGEEYIEVETGFRTDIEKENNLMSDDVVLLSEKVDINDREKYIVAVDIGTTTIAASKIDINAKKVVKTVTSVNHQRMYGADVISRMEASNQGEGKHLQNLILNDLEEMLCKLELPKDKTKMIISGNTTMGHLLQGYSCKTLGVAPYTPVDISLHEYKNMTMLPGISTYVGADIVSGIIACGMNQSKEVSILVDIGTNGEMAIGNKDRIMVASTAAGPAFEGGNISCGIAGVPGAIASVTIENETLGINTIGGENPIGICGSGVLEIVYELLKSGLIDETGLLDDEYFDDGYMLGEGITFSAKDIREVQLAKSAIRTGIEILVKEFGVCYDEIDKLYLAGGFGQHMNVKKAVGIGLLPEELEEKVVAVGNTSLGGATIFAIDEGAKKQFISVAERSKEISLAENRAFQDLYMDNMFFPE